MSEVRRTARGRWRVARFGRHFSGTVLVSRGSVGHEFAEESVALALASIFRYSRAALHLDRGLQRAEAREGRARLRSAMACLYSDRATPARLVSTDLVTLFGSAFFTAPWVGSS